MDLLFSKAEGVTPGWPPSLPRKTLDLWMWDSTEAMHETLNHQPLLLRLSTPSSLPSFPSLSHHRSISSPTARTAYEEVSITNLEVQSGATSRVVQLRRVCEAKLWLNEDRKPYVTDDSNYIVELHFKTPIKDARCRKDISPLEGVVDHGLFLDMVTAVIISSKTGVDLKAK